MGMCWAPECKHYSARERCRFFRFPRKKQERERWISLLRRDIEPGTGAYVCSCHFRDGLRENGPELCLHNVDDKWAHFEVRSRPGRANKLKKKTAQQSASSSRVKKRRTSTVPSPFARTYSRHFPNGKKKNKPQLLSTEKESTSLEQVETVEKKERSVTHPQEPNSSHTPVEKLYVDGLLNDSSHSLTSPQDLPKDPLSFTVKEEVFDPEYFPLSDLRQNDEMEVLSEAILNNDFHTIHLSYPYRNVSDWFGELVSNRLEKIADPIVHQDTMFEIHKILHRAVTCDNM